MIDRKFVAEVRALKDEYFISSALAFEYLKKRRVYDEWRDYIEQYLRMLGIDRWLPTSREVENLRILSECMVVDVLNVRDSSDIKADYMEAVLNFYRAFNRGDLSNQAYFEATMQLLPPEAEILGKKKILIGMYYILPRKSGNYKILKDLELVEEDIIDIVRTGRTASELNCLFCHYGFEGTYMEIDRQVSGDTQKKLGIVGFPDPIYLRLLRADMLNLSEAEKRIAYNFMVINDLETVQEAVEIAENEAVHKREETLDESLRLFVDPDSKSDLPALEFERDHAFYILKSLKKHRNFLEMSVVQRV